MRARQFVIGSILFTFLFSSFSFAAERCSGSKDFDIPPSTDVTCYFYQDNSVGVDDPIAACTNSFNGGYVSLDECIYSTWEVGSPPGKPRQHVHSLDVYCMTRDLPPPAICDKCTPLRVVVEPPGRQVSCKYEGRLSLPQCVCKLTGATRIKMECGECKSRTTIRPIESEGDTF